jgi:hypothetical protein
VTSNALCGAGAQDFPLLVNYRSQSHDRLSRSDGGDLDLGNLVTKSRGLQLHYYLAQIRVPVQVLVMALLLRSPREDLLTLILALTGDLLTLRLSKKTIKLSTHQRLRLFLPHSGLDLACTRTVKELLTSRISNHKFQCRFQCPPKRLALFPGLKAINLGRSLFFFQPLFLLAILNYLLPTHSY